MLYTGQRRSDMVTIGWQHISGNTIKVRQHKTKTRLAIPIHLKLIEVLAATPKENMTFLVTAFGMPFTGNGFGNWMRERCNEAAGWRSVARTACARPRRGAWPKPAIPKRKSCR
ncbi:MAG: hypothetical protein ACOY99_09500 [Pseudomonadota bacterium]